MTGLYSRHLLIEKLQLVAIDALVVFASVFGATWLGHQLDLTAIAFSSRGIEWSAYVLPAGLMAAFMVFLLRWEGLYAEHLARIPMVRLAKVVGIATMAVLALSFFYREQSYSRSVAAIFYPLCVASLAAARALYRGYLRLAFAHRHARCRVLIIGVGETGRHLGRTLRDNPSYYEIVGFLDDDPAHAQGALEDHRLLGTTSDLGRVIAGSQIDEVLVALPTASPDRVMDLVGECMRLKVPWRVVPNLFDLMLDRLQLDSIGGLPLIGLRGSRIVGFNWLLKRSFDLVFASIALILISPLVLLIAVLVKCTSRGPVLFRQTRVGLHGQHFTFFKFRSMKIDESSDVHREFTAEWIYGRTGGGEPRSLGAAAAPVHKITRDPRVTAVGRFIRRTSLDELPQFLNVLRGDMSVVGPRPALPYEVERYTEWHKRRLEVLPGITGLWQTSGRNSLTFEEMVGLDIQYIENWSLALDLKISFKTIPAMLRKGY